MGIVYSFLCCGSPCCSSYLEPLYDRTRLKSYLCDTIDNKIRQIDNKGSVLLKLCNEYKTEAEYYDQKKLIEEVEEEIKKVRQQLPRYEVSSVEREISALKESIGKLWTSRNQAVEDEFRAIDRSIEYLQRKVENSQASLKSL